MTTPEIFALSNHLPGALRRGVSVGEGKVYLFLGDKGKTLPEDVSEYEIFDAWNELYWMCEHGD